MSRRSFAVLPTIILTTAVLWACDGQLAPTQPSDLPALGKGGGAGKTVALDGGFLAAAQAVSTKRDNDRELLVESGTNAYTVDVALTNTKTEADKSEGSLCIFNDAASSESVRATLRSLLTGGNKTWTFSMNIDKVAVASGVGSKDNLLSVREGTDTPLIRIGANNQGEGHWPVVTGATDGDARVFTFQAAVRDAADPRGYTGANINVVTRLGTRANDPVAHMTCPLFDSVTSTFASVS